MVARPGLRLEVDKVIVAVLAVALATVLALIWRVEYMPCDIDHQGMHDKGNFKFSSVRECKCRETKGAMIACEWEDVR